MHPPKNKQTKKKLDFEFWSVYFHSELQDPTPIASLEKIIIIFKRVWGIRFIKEWEEDSVKVLFGPNQLRTQYTSGSLEIFNSMWRPEKQNSQEWEENRIWGKVVSYGK